MRLPRFMGERLARQAIMFDRTFYVEEPEAKALVNEVHPAETLDAAEPPINYKLLLLHYFTVNRVQG